MVTVGACVFTADISPVIFRLEVSSSSGNSKRKPMILKRRVLALSTEQPSSTSSTAAATSKTTPLTRSRSFASTESDAAEANRKRRFKKEREEDHHNQESRLMDYFDDARDMIRSDGGPPRWFSSLDCGSHAPDSPLLLFLPGAFFELTVSDLVKRQHQRLGKVYDVWCLHIPVKDRTSFTGLVKLIEITVRSENNRAPKRPIYLVGESLGACIALAVAARNPDIDLLLILANPATSFSNSVLKSAIPLLELIPGQMTVLLSYMLSLMTGDPIKMSIDSVAKGLSLQQMIPDLSQDLAAMSSYLPVLVDTLPKETLLWKLEQFEAASAYANSRLHAVKAETLVLCSVKDELPPSQEEGQRFSSALSKCQPLNFEDHGHFLLLEDGVDLLTIIKGAGYYRRGRIHDYVSDFIPPTSREFNKIYDDDRWMINLTSPMLLSTLEDDEIVRGLSGIPSEGPVVFVGYHNLLGLEAFPLVPEFMMVSNIVLRGLAHPMMFVKGALTDLSPYDVFRIVGAVPVSGVNFYKLMSFKSHVLLYPGGLQEALHRKGEEYKLFWPETSEFVRMAATFGAKIVPFGAVGEDDLAQVVLDYDDQMEIPYFKSQIEEIAASAIRLRTDTKGEVGNQQLHFPYFVPKVPGRFYYYFGKPIETKGRKRELRDRKKAHELYLEVKSEVENCLSYLKERRENDPYRNLLPRLAYQATHGFLASQVPTFEL